MLAAASRGPSPLPFARVPATQYHFMAQALDAGMLGLMIPMVESAEQARLVADSTRYPPVGRRGAGLGMAQDDYERGTTSEKIEALNARTFVMAQIESPAGLENLDAIAAVPGVDAIFMGPADLSFAYGVDFLTGIHPPVTAAIERMIAVCRARGIASGLGETSVEALERWRERGCTFLAYGPDYALLAGLVREGLARFRGGADRS